MKQKLQWGLIATGAIAHAFAKGLKESQTGALFAVGSRTRKTADDFGSQYGCKRCYGSYEALLADKDVQAVYISTPHPHHAEWTIKAAEAGKHVLVEKPIALNQYEAQAMIEAAVKNRVFLMEAYMYRCHPQTVKLIELLRENIIGDIRVIQATFSFHAGFDANSRIWNNALAGGGIMDVGGYTTSITRLIAGIALGKDFADPLSIAGAGSLHPETGVDVWTLAMLKFEKDITASLATGVGVNQENVVRIFGSRGNIFIPDPFVCRREGVMPGNIIVKLNDEKKPREIAIASPVTSFTWEADAAGRAIAEGKQEAPQMSWNDTLGNIKTQDAWRKAIGLTYESEKPQNYIYTVSHRPLAVRKDSRMTYGRIANLDKPVSKLVMGVDNQEIMPHAATVFDEYFERGGNAFDTAWIYGRVRSELLGHWINNRNIRDKVVIIAKGAHTPECNPDAIVRQLEEQLQWMQTGYADIYMMHRDNLSIPVREFVDVLNQLKRSGKIKTFGGSNWTIKRMEEANAYARQNGLQGFSVLSNNLSLAEMANSVWDGCLHVHDAASLKWLKENSIALLPWSSQARGFFLPGRAHPDKKEDAELVRCWYSEKNFQRLARANELAKRYNVEPINIALAWVMQQPFECFPLVGPRTPAEIRSTFNVLDVKLTEKDLLYLDTGA